MRPLYRCCILTFLAVAILVPGRTESLLPVAWNPKLQLGTLDSLPARLERPFDAPVRVKHGAETATLRNCAAYLKEMGRGFRAANDRDQRRLQLLRADCRALDLLRSARPARRSAIGDAWRDPRYLPPTLSFLPSAESRHQALAAQYKGLSWKDSEPGVRVTSSGPKQIAMDTGSGVVRLEWYARGDFDGDGVEDVLVRVATYAKQGTYATIRLFLLTRDSPEQVLRVLREID